MNTNLYATSLVLALGGLACATVAPPPELVAARATYAEARTGTAARYNPADLHTAEEALARADEWFASDGDTQVTRDLAYVAQRRAQIAQVRADTLQSNAAQRSDTAEMHKSQAQQLATTSVELGQANQKLATQGQELASERGSREAADKRAAQATAAFERVASVKQEPRGMVITLSGGVLFASSKSELLLTAQLKLNTVAETLTEQDPDSKLVVEGHTDSQGAMAYNQALSERRAQAVRDYLVSRGISADRVTSRGFGSSHSIADNASPEGRADNRRVEIVVQPKTSTM